MTPSKEVSHSVSSVGGIGRQTHRTFLSRARAGRLSRLDVEWEYSASFS
jgi:hypothetical protein